MIRAEGRRSLEAEADSKLGVACEILRRRVTELAAGQIADDRRVKKIDPVKDIEYIRAQLEAVTLVRKFFCKLDVDVRQSRTEVSIPS